MNKNVITVGAVVKTPISKVWEYWNKPEHIMSWAFASDTWEAPAAELQRGGWQAILDNFRKYSIWQN